MPRSEFFPKGRASKDLSAQNFLLTTQVGAPLPSICTAQRSSFRRVLENNSEEAIVAKTVHSYPLRTVHKRGCTARFIIRAFLSSYQACFPSVHRAQTPASQLRLFAHCLPTRLHHDHQNLLLERERAVYKRDGASWLTDNFCCSFHLTLVCLRTFQHREGLAHLPPPVIIHPEHS